MPSQQLNKGKIQTTPWRFVIGNSEPNPSLERLCQQSGLATLNDLANATNQDCLLVSLDQVLDQVIQGQLLPLNTIQALGLLVPGDAELEDIQAGMAQLQQLTGQIVSSIFIDFPVFTDGRGYSLGPLLHRSAWFTGQLGAIGDILQDQIYFYWRCGFDLIQPRQDQNIQRCQNALNSFTHAYQGSIHQP